MRCKLCGEPIKKSEPKAELYDPKEPEQGSAIVHGEECAQELLERGWEIA